MGSTCARRGSILARSALLLLVIRPANTRHVRVKVFALAVVAPGLYAFARIVLFSSTCRTGTPIRCWRSSRSSWP